MCIFFHPCLPATDFVSVENPGPITVGVYLSLYGNCHTWTGSIQVKLCMNSSTENLPSYVYQLTPPPYCEAAYCTENVRQGTTLIDCMLKYNSSSIVSTFVNKSKTNTTLSKCICTGFLCPFNYPSQYNIYKGTRLNVKH